MSEADDFLKSWAEQNDGLMEAAGALWGFYSALTAQGFDPGQALTLTATWFTTQMDDGK